MMDAVTFENVLIVIGDLRDRLVRIEELLKGLETSAPLQDGPLTIEQAAALLNLSKSAVYAKVGQNDIPFSKKGKRLYFDKGELLAWINSGKGKSSEEIAATTEKIYKRLMKRR